MSGETLTLSPQARGFGALRVLSGNRARTYDGVFVHAEGWPWLNHHFRMAKACGIVSQPRDDDYATLDVYDADGDILQEFGIDTDTHFRWWYRKMEWRVVSTDGDGS